jgi:hypothetical protein
VLKLPFVRSIAPPSAPASVAENEPVAGDPPSGRRADGATATAGGSIAQGESGVELQIAATLTDSTGATLVANGLTCAIPAGIDIK